MTLAANHLQLLNGSRIAIFDLKFEIQISKFEKQMLSIESPERAKYNSIG